MKDSTQKYFKDLCVNKCEIYNIIKVMTIILVVIAHISRMYTTAGAVPIVVTSEVLAYFTSIIYKFHMPLFIMVSGGIYSYCLECGKYRNTNKFIVNKAKRLLIPYIFWGIFVVAPVMVLLNLTELNYINYCVNNIILCKDSRHLWYVVTLFFIFLIAIYIRRVENNICLLLFSVFLHVICRFISVHVLINNILHYQFYFFVGYFINIYFNIFLFFVIKVKKLIVFGIGSLVILSQYDKNIITNDLLAFLGCFNMFSIAIFIELYIPNIKNTQIYKIIKRDGYGIYLIHPMLIYILFYIFRNYYINPYVFLLGAFIVVFMMSIFGIGLLRKSKLRIIIGEK